MPQPNFFIVGATKSGTSSLARYLPQHPEIAMCQIKEPDYYSYHAMPTDPFGPGKEHWRHWGPDSHSEYLKLFDHARSQRVIGEASVSYLSTPGVAELIRTEVPAAKILVILRNPIDRAFSAYQHLKREGKETLSFSEGLALEPIRRQQNHSLLWLYRGLGFYSEQLKPYLKLFPQNQIRITTYDDWENQPKLFLKQLFDFLEVDAAVQINRQYRDNISGVPRSKRFHAFTTKPNRLKSALTPLIPRALRRRILYSAIHLNLERETISESCWQDLATDYQGEIQRLESLLQRDLSHWLKKPDFSLKSPPRG